MGALAISSITSEDFITLRGVVVVAAIAFIIGDLVLEVYETVNLAVLGMFLLAGGILGLAIDSAAVGLGTAIVLALWYLVVHRRPGHRRKRTRRR